ncbi:TIGR03089 family protein [Paractinoplanes rishiriensis]|uniref:TIGR03089 family protein n=1 Tax=Paractinoplanes rishiriensis TaxID=1050105 RepID=A0A919JX08_9ACTN|nr:TIGR03089 family protein [Actinoplanes rishiriensis]GIE94857.1 hypothetical protein Ari01nite_23220 [Actinoplanes rishiriensis]
MTHSLHRTDVDELITYYDDATGERAGLTAAELGGWSAATAALLTEGCGLGPGSRVAVLLPAHWQTAAVLLGAWSAGVEVSFRGWSTAGLEPAGDPLDATFVALNRAGSWLDEVPAGCHQFVLGFAPEAGPAPQIPEGYRDFATEIRPYLGAAPPTATVGWSDAATVDGSTYGEYESVAVGIAESRGLQPGDRVLIDVTTREHPLIWLLAPLTVGASIVLCANLDRSRLDDRVTRERVTHIFGD